MSDKDNILEFEGVVDNFVKDKAFVKVSDNYMVICTVSGKIRQSGIRILAGDKVKIECSPYDPNKGRITYRLK